VENFDDLQTELDRERRKVDVDHFDITIREIVRMVLEDELHLAPEYQRKFRWDSARESQLIESLYLGLPVPSIFVATNPNGTWELVDGLQRVSTIVHYVCSEKDELAIVQKESSLKLTDLEKLTKFQTLVFSDLPTPLQLAFSRRALRVTALSDKSDSVVRFDLFERLNTGGIVLTPQEVRACIYRGKFSEFIQELAENTTFRSLIKLQKLKREDGTPEELILKFFAYLLDSKNFKGNVKGFLNDFMGKSTKKFDFTENKLIFEESVEQLSKILNGKQFLRSNYVNTPLNQFEAVLVAIGKMIIEGKKIATPKQNWLDDDELIRWSSGGTNTQNGLNRRVERSIFLLSGEK
jgi:Protein of unknown function DUF262